MVFSYRNIKNQQLLKEVDSEKVLADIDHRGLVARLSVLLRNKNPHPKTPLSTNEHLDQISLPVDEVEHESIDCDQIEADHTNKPRAPENDSDEVVGVNQVDVIDHVHVEAINQNGEAHDLVDE